MVKNRYKITIPFIDEDDERFIDALDLQTGITYGYYEQEFEAMKLPEHMQVKKYVLKRMHLIRAGAYDDENTEPPMYVILGDKER
ncbi:hypothetical protein [Oceanobacillus sp. J11TS1]|uniref:hypothetical protein n=1 Tax=Oceanobacillus sp. J11TS1 TaxID=2807191 RepID=UPI001B0CC3A0|nr:hypothetical protein [Oceanobacillus sp. J11TS1]GIO22409.1 hypothetical protein J11TS1_09900 [Oceanobacillus sp. J11TS1]